MTNGRIYLDNNATTSPLPEVVEAMDRHWRDGFANPGSRHADGRIARLVLEEARETIARILDADPGEVVFASGGTEAINLALFGLAAHHPADPALSGERRNKPRRTILLTPGEHPATMQSCRFLEARGWKLHVLELDPDGRIRPEQYDSLPWKDVRLATILFAHNETGVIQEVSPLAERCRQHDIPLHLDAVQAVGKIPVSFRESGAAALSLGAHKFHGPRGIGALLIRKDITPAPLLFGGHQEAGRRPGTEPVALAAGMAKALEIWNSEQEARMWRVGRMRDRLAAGLAESAPPIVIHAAAADRLPNTLSIAFPGVDGEALLVNLDLVGISCSLGSTCASGSAEPAPVLVAMRVPPEIALSTVRFSVGIDNVPEEIDEAVNRIAEVVRRMRASDTTLV